ncbi:zinc-finger of transposase IS204/IS1001/IS1096/IS1165, partial [Brevibacterium sp. Mu109]
MMEVPNSPSGRPRHAQRIFTTPDLDAFCLLDTLDLTVTGQAVDVDQAVLECRTTRGPDSWCHECGTEGIPRGTAIRRLVHIPLGWRPTILHVRVRRYRCLNCARVWREDLTTVAAPRAKLSRPAVLWALKCLVIDRMSISRIAASLGASWHTVNTAILATGQQLLLDDPTRFDGVRVLGVDEYVWRHTPFGSKYVTVIIDLTPIRDKTGPSRLLDIVEGRSKKVFKTWLAAQSQAFRRGVEDVAMDGFAGYKSAAAEELPDAVPVMDPFHVVALAGGAHERCRQRIQQDVCDRLSVGRWSRGFPPCQWQVSYRKSAKNPATPLHPEAAGSR